MKRLLVVEIDVAAGFCKHPRVGPCQFLQQGSLGYHCSAFDKKLDIAAGAEALWWPVRLPACHEAEERSKP